MDRKFPLLRQPSGSSSCLPTAVRAVLLSYGRNVTQAEVSEWCQEGPDGCVTFLAVGGLSDEGFDVIPGRGVEELTELASSDDPEPVIITIKNPDRRQMSGTDHAVVVLDIRREIGMGETVKYMDPLDGLIHTDTTVFFMRWWDFNGNYGFVVRP